PFDELVYDFQVRPLPVGPDKQARSGVLFGVMQHRNLSGLYTLIRTLDLTLLSIELSPCSVERLWDCMAGSKGAVSSYAHVHLESSDATVLLSQNGWPILFRTVQLTSEAGSAEQRQVDVSRSVDFAWKELGAQPPAEIRLSGTHHDLKGWSKVLSL